MNDPELLDGLRAARKQAREHAWELGLAPERVTIDLDATLLGSHSEKEGAAGTSREACPRAPGVRRSTKTALSGIYGCARSPPPTP